jgi:DNA-directed RNA polymerase sigma subunit (sigma70/sigma32)
MQNNKECQEKTCRLWIDFPEEKNCSLISIFENGPMTLRQVGDRIGVSFARIKQIETEALRKMKKNSLLLE